MRNEVQIEFHKLEVEVAGIQVRTQTAKNQIEEVNAASIIQKNKDIDAHRKSIHEIIASYN